MASEMASVVISMVIPFFPIGIASLFVLVVFSASAEQACEKVLTRENSKASRVINEAEQAEVAFQKRVDLLESRLATYYANEWHRPNYLSDAFAAVAVTKKLRRFGGAIDLEIFDTYIAILEATSKKYNVRSLGFYIDKEMGQRPKSSHFQERHWDWNILDGYFFNSPSTLTITKENDLAYLQHVLKTARSKAEKSALKNVLFEANTSWHQQSLAGNLADLPEMSREFRSFLQDKDYHGLYVEVLQKIREWRRHGDMEQVSLNNRHMVEALKAFYSSNNAFDLFIFQRYFELVQRHSVKSDLLRIDPKIQMTDWSVFENGLASGSLQCVTDFLFQNAHDSAMKIYFLRILDGMRLLPSTTDFKTAFLEARIELDRKLVDIEPPPQLQADLQIFTVTGDRPVTLTGSFNSMTEVKVRWNRKLGKLQANVVDSAPFLQEINPPVSTNARVVEYLKTYFRKLASNQTVGIEQIKRSFKRELRSPLIRNTYFVFSDPISGDLMTMVRVFNGTPVENNANEALTYIEKDFPKAKFPEREKNIPISEIGRLFADSRVEGYSLPLIMARVADFLANSGTKGVVYMDAVESGKNYYRRFGVEVVFTPSDLSITDGQTPVWILRMSIPQFIREFARRTFETVRKRDKRDARTDGLASGHSSQGP
jgi:hypothetical protein